jgi:hypothetical protein
VRRRRTYEVQHRGVIYAVRISGDGHEVELLANWVTVGRGRLSVRIETTSMLGGDARSSESILRSLEAAITRMPSP